MQLLNYDAGRFNRSQSSINVLVGASDLEARRSALRAGLPATAVLNLCVRGCSEDTPTAVSQASKPMGKDGTDSIKSSVGVGCVSSRAETSACASVSCTKLSGRVDPLMEDIVGTCSQGYVEFVFDSSSLAAISGAVSVLPLLRDSSEHWRMLADGNLPVGIDTLPGVVYHLATGKVVLATRTPFLPPTPSGHGLSPSIGVGPQHPSLPLRGEGLEGRAAANGGSIGGGGSGGASASSTRGGERAWSMTQTTPSPGAYPPIVSGRRVGVWLSVAGDTLSVQLYVDRVPVGGVITAPVSSFMEGVELGFGVGVTLRNEDAVVIGSDTWEPQQ